MQSIGAVLKGARVKKKLSLDTLSVKTKIRREFLEAIENENWATLPEFPVVMGFVKSIAGALKLGVATTTALLKRDYPPKKLNINPKPDVSKKFIWSPRLTFLFGILTVSFVVFGYLIYQYISFISPPGLTIENPKEAQEVTMSEVFVSGKTESDATVKVNNQPVLVDDEGNLSTDVEIASDTKEIIIIAVSRSGKETVVRRNIEVNLGNSN